MRKLLLVLAIPSILLSLVSQKATGQNIITIGTGTTANSGTTYPAPYGNWYWGAKNQMLITAAELNAAGASAGPINSLAFNVQTVAGIALVNFTVKFKNTSSTTSASTFESGMTTVWGPQTYTESSGWNVHTFGSSFNWDGSSNLLIETCFNNSSYVTNASTYFTTTGFNSCVYVRSDASGVCGLTNGTISGNRPNMQLDFGPMADHDVGVSAIIAPGSGCTLGASENVTITIRNYGDSTQTSIPVSYRINGGAIISETVTTTLTTGSTYDYTFSATADLSTAGSYYFDAWTSLSGDTINTNDSVASQLVTNTNPITSFPWVEPFTSFTVGSPGTFVSNWVNETGDDMDWWVNSGGTSSGSTGPTSDHTTGSGKYLYLEANGNSLKTALATSPCMDISSISVPVLDFWYHMYGTTMGSLYVDILSGGVWYLGVDSIIGDQGNAWINKQVNLSTFSTGGVTVRFRGIVGTGTTSDMAIDDISIINVAVAPIAEFAADNIFTCNGIVSYTDLSTNFPGTWLWNFGDGNTSTAQHPTHTYTSSGTFTVSLVVTNTYGTDSETKASYVTVALGGPVSASCAPVTTSYCCGMGIFNFTFNTINNTTNDGIDSYQDYSCANTTTVTEGKTYWLSVQTGTTYDENVVVWIDFDNDGVFNATDTIFFSNALINHMDSITIPTGATLGAPLRLRVASDYGPNVVPTPCTAVTYGQFEDYTIVIQPDTFPPVTNFIADATMSCNGVVNFTDLSTSTPTSWFWDFGDGVTSTNQNPTHTYTTDTVYNVTLATCNSWGCDTLVKAGYITVSAGGPIAASCYPVTTAYCCGFGITNVTFGSINNTTNDGVDSYQDYTCQQGTNVTEGNVYALSITTDNPTTHNTVVWIDFDNSGSYDTTEIVLKSFSSLYPAGSVTIPSGAVLNTPLRMRVSSDYDIEAVPTPCGNVTYGQVEDYSVTVLANTNPPVAEFTASDNNSCDGIITFTDNTLNVPTTWFWDFGDGNTSTAQSPTHTYASDSSFTITLTVTNAFGADSITKTNFVTVTLGGQPIAPSCTPTTVSYCCGYGIYNVTFGSISNSTNDGIDGYQDYSCDYSATFTEGNSYSIAVQTSATNSQDTRVWIDFDNNGTFNTTTELVFSSNNQFNPTGTATIQAVAGYNIPLRMRVVSDYAGSNPGPCTNLANGQAEDYSIYVVPGNPTVTVTPTSINVGTAMVAATTSGTFAVCNTGTDPLVVSSMVADSSQFTASPNSFVVNPGGCQTVTVNLTPTYIGSITSLLYIYTNDVDTFITVSGAGAGAPTIDTDPDSIIVTLTSCGDSIVVPLTVYNTGVSDLHFCVEGGSGGGSVSDSVQMLALTLDVDMGTEFPNTISAISQYYTKFNLTQINTTSASALQAALVGKDVLLMPEREGGSNAVYSGFATVMQTFVNDGGTVIFCGSSSSYTPGIFNTGLFSGSYIGNLSGTNISLVNTSYPITDTVNNPFQGTNAFFYYDLTNSDIIPIAQYNGYECVALREVGSNGGRVIMIGADFFAYNNDVARLIANSVKWAAGSGSMISSSVDCDTLVAGDSTIVYITINTANMNSGTYTSEIILSSNDPATPYDTIPIIVNYVGQPTIGISDTCLSFGTVMVGATVSDTVTITNTGCDTLIISSITGTNSDYSAASTSFYILPGDSFNLGVQFTPSGLGTSNGTITIYNNDVDTTICLNGAGAAAPIISTNPDSVNISISSCCDSMLVPVTIYNTGGADLIYTTSIGGGGGGGSSFDYSEAFVSGTGYCPGDPQYDNWVTFRSQLDTIQYAFSSVTISGSNDPTGRTCTDVTMVRQMAAALRNGTTGDWIGCNGFNWHVGVGCSGGCSITGDGISFNADGYNCSCSSDYILRPGIGNDNWGGIGGSCSATSQTLAVSFEYVGLITGSSTTDTIAGGDSAIVNIDLNWCGLDAGVYTSELIIFSNDPATPIDTVPVTLNLIGAPIVNLSDTCLSYGSIMVGATVSDTITITNTGCDTLTISTITMTNPDYTVASTSFSILPGDSFNLGVLFTPGAMGNSNGTITIFNNDVDTTICVSGIGVGAPVITVVPTSLTANIIGCEDSVVIPVTLYNTGLGPLDYDITGGFQAYDSTSLTVYTTSGATTSHTFTGLTNNDSIYITVRLNGDFDSSTEYADLYVDGTYIGQIVDNNVTNGTDIIVTYAFGGSNVTSWLSDGQITVNIVNSSGVNTFVGTEIHEVRLQMNESWLGISPDSGTVVIGDSSIVYVTFYSSGLSGGTYYTDITINTNDPANPTIVIPCTLVVSNIPCADFNVTNVSLCTGSATFADNSTNTPTSWAWNFGNGNTSNVQNPTTTFTTGTYTVQLIVCNGSGCDTTTQTVNITSSSGPINASCSPITNSYCCGMGIMNVTFNNINNTTGDGVDGYQDYTCVTSTDLFVGQTYTLSVETSTGYLENVKAWIDYDNNGVFAGSEEVMFSASVQQYHTGSVTIPGGAVSNTPLRMRIGDDYYTESVPDPCTAVTYGQFEDYTVVIVEPPVAAFTSSVLSSCQGAVQFNDISTGNPTSWAWDFGDGNTSTAQNPLHTYSASGPYIAQLTVCNPSGCDVYTFTVTISNIGGPTAACIPATTANCCGMGILNVNLNTINNSSNDGSAGYEDFGCTISTSLIVQQSYTITIQTGLTSNENVNAWIDYNDNGVFEASELILTSVNQLANHTATFSPPITALLNTEVRMRIGSDYYLESAPTSCSDVVYGQFEDYAVTILPNNIPPVANFADSLLDPCQGIVQFTDASTNTPTSWSWDFGDGSGISSQQNPLYVYATADTFTVVLIATNAFGSDTITQQVIASPLSASFTTDVNPVQVASVITFTNTGSGVTFDWDFGDGYSSNLENPAHVYIATGIYTVTLTVSNSQGCSAQYTMDITVKLVVIGIEAVDYSEMLSIYPNPTNDRIYINLKGFQGRELSIRMVDVLGKEVWANDYGTIHDLTLDHDLSPYQKGMYIMYITIGDLQYAKKIILE